MKKRFEKLLSLILALLMLLSVGAPAVTAAEEEKYPVVFLAGYTSTRLWYKRGTSDEMRVWKPHIEDKVKNAVKSEMPGIIGDAGLALVGYYDKLFDTLEPYIEEVIEYMKMNPDGTMKYELEVYPHSVEDTRLDKLKKIGYLPDADSLKGLGEGLGDKNVYCCTIDWRMGQVDCAAVLDSYIDDVLRATGAKKVNLCGVSFGGQVAASYICLYGADKINRVVLNCPALDGSSIVSQLLSEKKIKFAWRDAADLYLAYSKTEIPVSDLAAIVSPAFLGRFMQKFIDRFFIEFFVNFPSVWDLVPLSEYETLKEKLLNDGKHDGIIEKSDKYHYEVAAKRKELFSNIESEGVPIYIICGTSSDLVVSDKISSDGVIDVSSTSGAAVAKLGDRLSEDEAGIKCGAEGHDHLSPFAEINAATGYLPEHTWFVREMRHGMGSNEKKIKDLINTLFDKNEITDVYSSPLYPQFMASENKTCGVVSKFSSCAEGFITKYSTVLTVTNLSEKNEIEIDGIKCSCKGLSFKYVKGARLAPGESMDVEVYGKLPEKDMESVSVDVGYIVKEEKYTAARNRVQYFSSADAEENPQIMTITPSDDTPIIPEGKGKVTIKLSFPAFITRVLYSILKIFFHR
ncbi:MAG: alpha/beta fold hydrolase [Clostridiales bacterium]|nr:alpha/beta fold hydrolase [Clostridiales bacterium]